MKNSTGHFKTSKLLNLRFSIRSPCSFSIWSIVAFCTSNPAKRHPRQSFTKSDIKEKKRKKSTGHLKTSKLLNLRFSFRSPVPLRALNYPFRTQGARLARTKRDRRLLKTCFRWDFLLHNRLRVRFAAAIPQSFVPRGGEKKKKKKNGQQIETVVSVKMKTCHATPRYVLASDPLRAVFGQRYRIGVFRLIKFEDNYPQHEGEPLKVLQCTSDLTPATQGETLDV